MLSSMTSAANGNGRCSRRGRVSRITRCTSGRRPSSHECVRCARSFAYGPGFSRRGRRRRVVRERPLEDDYVAILLAVERLVHQHPSELPAFTTYLVELLLQVVTSKLFLVSAQETPSE